MSPADHFEREVKRIGQPRREDIHREGTSRSLPELPVQQRAAELAKANASLLAEMVERNRVEEALRQAEEKYRSICEIAVERIYQLTPAGVFLNVNPALARMYGFATP